MNQNLFVMIAASAVIYGTPLLYAALGELLAERAGVLNLGIEGMMLMGAVVGFWAVQNIGGPDWFVLVAALLLAALAGLLTSLVHAVLVITLRANQIVTGLAITIFAGAAGLSSYLGNVWNLGGVPARHTFATLDVFGLAKAPIVGPIIFHQNILVYVSWVLVAAVCWYLYRSRWGLHLRAVGEAPASADTMGINVSAYRYVHTLIGGALAGIGGAMFSLALTPSWLDGLTNGAGWIALALVIFAFWRPELTILGAYLFGAFSSLGFTLQARGVRLSPSLLNMLPYVMTVIVLVVVSTGWAKRRLGAPAALGFAYVREER